MTYKKEKTQYTGDWKNDKKEGEGILAKFINNTYKEMIRIFSILSELSMIGGSG